MNEMTPWLCERFYPQAQYYSTAFSLDLSSVFFAKKITAFRTCQWRGISGCFAANPKTLHKECTSRANGEG